MAHIRKILFLSLIVALLQACSFKKDESLNTSGDPSVVEKVSHSAGELVVEEDEDGDGATNGFEVEVGSNPLVADFPKIRYTISRIS